MGYITNRYGKKRRARPGLGGLFDDIVGAITGGTHTVETAVSAASDPYLPEVICHIGQLQAIDRGQPAGVCTETPPGLPGGVGLRNAVVPMRGYVYAQQHKWVYPVAVAAILGLPFLAGYSFGKDR